MDNNFKAKIFGKLVSENELKSTLKDRKQKFDFETIPCASEEEKEMVRAGYEVKGWEFDRYYSKSVRMKKLKAHHVLFENKVWKLFALLNFNFMNRSSDFKLPYDKLTPPNTQQIDVFAKDDETVLFIECKSSKKKGTSNLKEVLEAWKTKKQGVEKSIKNLFPDQTLKKKFILFTENLELSDSDEKRLLDISGIHFDENKLDYYLNMYSQIGLATKYQILADIFAGTVIPELDNKVPAIKGTMGGHTYYSFSVEPDKLLKISYVLHRSKANENMMPTYQRIIKKSRLNKIHDFLDNEDKPGYFPNSIIVNIDTDGKKLGWDPASPQVESSISKIGVLHLPQKYRSAFIIDGQHRLYGYSDSKYKSNNTVPVVAFVNLSREEQVNLFIQINENQKAVPKTLRETLKADMLWTSKDKREQLEALRSRIAVYFGEKNGSAFVDYMSLGEDNRVITPASVSNGLKKGNFLGKVEKSKIIELGTFYNGDLDDTLERLYDFLNLSFKFLKSQLMEDFNERKQSFLFVNKGITSIIMLLSDIVDHIEESENRLKFTNQNKDQYMDLVFSYLTPVIDYVKNIDPELKSGLMKEKGASAPTKYWRKFQAEVRKSYPLFSPKGLEEYMENEEKALNNSTYALIREIESYMMKDYKQKLIDRYGEEWAWKKGIPHQIQEMAEKEMRQKNRTRSKSEETDEWDNLNLIFYRTIAEKNWSYMDENKKRVNFFMVHYTKPGDEKLKKEDQTKWFHQLNEIRKIVSHVSSDQVSEKEYNFVKSIHDWLVEKNQMNAFQQTLKVK
ncbi:DGQHR domain-containing protein [Fulvivirgaceae bacterium BMA10]|uniref:DGQHR domain-containing protein n=1 Tax=Splendidivirga corallicola TaxID=3051826 RepID=A0ABT8KTZ1_9BACT|nr:DGQHR domain-containing protein [Fulvivirgaceae bacterium BMA10]